MNALAARDPPAGRPPAPQADPPPPDPEIERQSFKVAEGFEVTSSRPTRSSPSRSR